MSEPHLLRAADVAARLRVSLSAAYRLIAAHPKRVSIGRSVRIPEADLAKFVKRGAR